MYKCLGAFGLSQVEGSVDLAKHPITHRAASTTKSNRPKMSTVGRLRAPGETRREGITMGRKISSNRLVTRNPALQLHYRFGEQPENLEGDHKGFQ